MTTRESQEFDEVFAQVIAWPPERRRMLADRLMRPAAGVGPSQPAMRGVPVEAVRGLGAGNGPAPDDAVVAAWKDEHLSEKYGR